MSRLVSTGLLLALSTLVGCAQPSACIRSADDCPTAPLPVEMQAERGSLKPDVSAVSSFNVVDQTLGTSPPVQYRVLRAEEVQCLAAANAPMAKLYASESEAVRSNPSCHGQRSAQMLSQLMAFRAIQERNKAAGTALELFYALAEAEASRDILQRSIAEIDRAVQRLDQLKRSGLTIPMDRTALERQKLDALDRQVRLQAALREMQGQLQQLCGFDADPFVSIWPQADLTVTVAAIDLQAAIGEGLANRADLAALRMLRGSLNAETLPAARSSMQTISPGLGASAAGQRLLGGSGGNQEVASRQDQLAQAQNELERTASREISQAAWNVETRLREIAVAKQRCEVWGQRVAELQAKRRTTSGVTAFDLSAAQLELLGAESDMVHRVIAWKMAQAKLGQAQGLLAAQCGYSLPCRCCP